MGIIPEDKASGEEVAGSEFDTLRNIGYSVDGDAGETINGETLPVAVYFDNTDNEWKACDANDQDKLEFSGFAISNSTDGNPIQVQASGIVDGFTGLTLGEIYYVQDDKTIDTPVGTYEIKVGKAISATQILIEPGSFEYTGTDTPDATTTPSFTTPTSARFAIIKVTMTNNDSKTINGQIVIAKKGFSTDVFGGTSNFESGGISATGEINFTWSGLTLSGNVQISGNAPKSYSSTPFYYR